MTSKKVKPGDDKDVSVEQKLIALYSLQQIDAEIDKIRIIRGELPLEVSDLEDEIAGLNTRIEKFNEEIEALHNSIGEKQAAITDSNALIKRYEEQLLNVRNNREYDALSKEVEFQKLEIELAEKKMKEAKHRIDLLQVEVDEAQAKFDERSQDLVAKKDELDGIVEETRKDELELQKKSEANENYIEERLLTAYKRIRKNARNGLAVVQIERDACGGCFNKIPPQHQLDIKLHKKIIVCEYCGRILVDNDIAEKVANQ